MNDHCPDYCPHCDSYLWRVYDDKPAQRCGIGVEVRGVYDGVLYYACPFCFGTWHRWPKDHHLWATAETHRAWFTNEMHRGDKRQRSRQRSNPPCSE